MSEENNDNLGDELKDQADDLKKDAKEAADTVAEEAKSAAKDIKESWNETTSSKENKKLLAGLLAILVGYLGVHKFILGYNKEGFILLGGFVVGLLTYCFIIGIFIIMAVAIVPFIEGIIYLTKSDEDFYETYQANKKPWF
ncbi:NINE protein [Aureitalea sp. L0-47]|uniref:NINE protein n=1 Tax=Aureitalea sp. L0-47 TaxID=2816962 RepID=UPI0022380FDF|nr:NINE protein [Aureitalea sp. L0-47]MCW5519005.1 NINE protein [Aureitalea sp. L0-47]